MMKARNKLKLTIVVITLTALITLTAPGSVVSARVIRYEGSSTIGKFIDIASHFYGKSTIMMNVMSESAGGEECVLKGRCDIGGVAREVNPQFIEKGARATLIGKDALAMIVNSENPVTGLSLLQIKGIFTGKIVNWKDLGGPDRAIEVLITAPKSATHEVFKKIVLNGAEYSAKIIVPDSGVVLHVSRNRWAVGQISFFFLEKVRGVKPIMPDGEEARFDNPDYPVSRPLYLVTAASPKEEVKDFIDWILSAEGQDLLKKFFIGIK
jgi:phosphate transport system substrate-binding protein